LSTTSSELQTALIAAGSAIFGGVLSAVAGVRVERLRQIAARRERVEQRRISAIQNFTVAAIAWFEWLTTMTTNVRISRDEVLDENNRRSRERQKAYGELKLLCSDEIYSWLESVYDPAEYKVRRHIVGPLIRGEPLSDEASSARDEYRRLLTVEMPKHFRLEVASLRGFETDRG
jgi:hypothetical protein